jgi:UDP-N-acetylglucosamine--N-acetylmuramyl-(pentapeptide) pyrophosphoryl-undecaprenol N-acetylglucosamine transferase
VVVGFGGYPSVPTMLAASRAGIVTVLHEQNAVLGRANRLLAGRAARVATAFPKVETFGRVAPERMLTVGNPVRAAIIAVGTGPYPAVVADAPVRLLVTGGSQGARVFGRVGPAAVALLPEAMRRRLAITQQCRPENLDEVRAAYAGQTPAPELSAFFQDMPERLAAANLVICRSGASTTAELTAAGRPAILVPYPFATDDHQTANAQALAEAGGAWLMPERTLTPETLAAQLQSLLAEPHQLCRAAACARSVARPDAAARLADAVIELLPENGASHEPREAAA